MKLKIDHYGRLVVLLLLAFGLSNAALAQRTITGTVTDSQTGDPLIGANILVVGTSIGTITDIDGSFSIDVPEGATELEVTYTGYGAQRVAIGASNVIDVALTPGEFLEEIVVVGYGTQKQKEVTSSIVSVDAADFNRGNVNNPTQLLQGKVAGLTIAKPGGNPNEGFALRLRGLSTFGANAEPLIIIDGIIGGSLDLIDPNDIASIDVLKDGSAAAIYGTRASSGVIIITTKSGGQAGRSAVNYNGYVAIDQGTNFVPHIGAAEFVERGGSDFGNNTNWYDEISRTGVSHVHNLSMEGSTGNTNYRVSLNFRDIQGVARFNGFEQVNGRVNLTQKAINDRLTLSVNLAATNRNAEFGFNEAWRYATIFNPTAPIKNPDGSYFELDLFDYFNPVAIIEQNTNVGRLKRLSGNIRAEYELMDGLTASVFYSQQQESDLTGQYYRSDARFRGQGRNGLARRFSEDRSNELFEVTGTLDRDLGNLNLKILGGYSWQELGFQNLFVEAGNFISDAFGFNALNVALDIPRGQAVADSRREEARLISFFGRVNLNYDDTYFFSASLRREGSSKFGPDNRWGNFWAASGGVALSNLFDISGVDNLKLRAGIGVTGNTPVQNYEYLQRLGKGSNFFFNGDFVPSFGPASNPNPDLKWEEKTEINIGLDFALLDYKLTGSIEYYTRTSEDVLQFVDVSVPPNLFPRTLVNVGELESNGLELAVNYSAISNQNLTWETGLTFSTFKTELVKFTNDRSQDDRANVGAPGQNGTFMIRLEEGKEIGNIFGPVFLGLNDDGSWNFADLDGDGTFCNCENDFAIIGNGLPDFEIGWNNTLTFGNFDFNVFFRGAFGHDLVNLFRVFYEVPSVVSNLNVNMVKTKFFLENLTDPADFNSYQVEDASFLKLDNATLGYTVDLPESSAFNRLRFYVSGQNLFVITDYTGVDPEVRFFDPGDTDNAGESNTIDILSPGIDRRNTYFRTRTITFGVNVGF